MYIIYWCRLRSSAATPRLITSVVIYLASDFLPPILVDLVSLKAKSSFCLFLEMFSLVFRSHTSVAK